MARGRRKRTRRQPSQNVTCLVPLARRRYSLCCCCLMTCSISFWGGEEKRSFNHRSSCRRRYFIQLASVMSLSFADIDRLWKCSVARASVQIVADRPACFLIRRRTRQHVRGHIPPPTLPCLRHRDWRSGGNRHDGGVVHKTRDVERGCAGRAHAGSRQFVAARLSESKKQRRQKSAGR